MQLKPSTDRVYSRTNDIELLFSQVEQYVEQTLSQSPFLSQEVTALALR